MTYSKQIRIEAFQFRVQTHINVADDEIARLKSFLNSIKAEIADAEDQLNKFTTQYECLNSQEKGHAIKKELSKETELSNLRMGHYSAISHLREYHSYQLNSVHRDFEKYFNNIDVWLAKKIIKSTASIDQKIEKLKLQLQQVKEVRDNVKRSGENSNNDDEEIKMHSKLESDATYRLEESLQEKQQIHYELLSELKDQLREVVTMIEDEERAHVLKVSEMKRKIDAIDKKFQIKLKQEVDKHEREIKIANKKLQDVRNHARIIHQRLLESRLQNAQKMSEVMIDSENIKSSVSQNGALLRVPEQKFIYTSPFRADERNVERFRRKLEIDQNILLQERTRNEVLRREIARTNHELRVASHRSAFV